MRHPNKGHDRHSTRDADITHRVSEHRQDSTQQHHAGLAWDTQGGHSTRKKYKRVHKSTFNCAKMIAWSTGDGSGRSSQHAPLAPLLIGI